MARLVVSSETQADLDEILRWLTHEAGGSVALRYATKFRAAFRHLMAFPEIAARRPKLARDMHIWPVAPYVIFYRFVMAEEVWVVRILHGRRDVTERLFGPQVMR